MTEIEPKYHLPQFVDSRVCQSKEHCKKCRKLESGRDWRRSLTIRWYPPMGMIDFPCPMGEQWEKEDGQVTTERIDKDPKYRGFRRPTPRLVPTEFQERKRVGITSALGRIANGIVSTVKTSMGIDESSQLMYESRKKTCETCDLNLYQECVFGTRHCCGKILSGKGSDPNNPGCGCILENKWKDEKQKCPYDKW